MFTKLRKYLANKIYNQSSIIELQLNYINMLHDSLAKQLEFGCKISNLIMTYMEDSNKSLKESSETIKNISNKIS